MTLPDGKTSSVTKNFEVGIRTDDTLVIGWIDAKLVPLSVEGVNRTILSRFPPNGVVPNNKDVSLFKIATLSGFFKPIPGSFMEDADRTYLLNWLFKFAPNPPSPASFADEAAVYAFTRNGHNYKLFNRFQIKYRTDGVKFT